MPSVDLSQILIGLAAILGPILVYFSSKRASRDAAIQTIGAHRVTETAQQLDTWKAIAERHEADRNDARAQERQAMADRDEERERRRKVEADNDALRKERHELFAEFSALRGAVVGQIGLTAVAFDRLSAEEEMALQRGARQDRSLEIAEHRAQEERYALSRQRVESQRVERELEDRESAEGDAAHDTAREARDWRDDEDPPPTSAPGGRLVP